MTTPRLIKSMGRSPLRLALLLIPLVFACFALSPSMQAQKQNTEFGTQALANNTTGDKNTAIGHWALHNNRKGSLNTATGFQALSNNAIGEGNTANGAFALDTNFNGNNNTATGSEALRLNLTGTSNTATGAHALINNTTGRVNTATGVGALFNNTIGNSNAATGANALAKNTAGNNNTATGVDALFGNTTGHDNAASGVAALNSNTAGSNNTATGVDALLRNTTGHNNTALGYRAGSGQETGSGNIYIGAEITGVDGESDACYIGRIFMQTSASGIPVLINSNNKLGTTTSSKRFKEDIKPMDKASEALLGLKPVTFRYKKEIDPARTSQFGLVAEDVGKVNPDLVVLDKEGPYSVRYDQVNAMLLNEFLKEHQKVRELEKQVEKLTTGLQKVSAQLEASKPAPQVVNNP